jgi:hypothetical protein
MNDELSFGADGITDARANNALPIVELNGRIEVCKFRDALRVLLIERRTQSKYHQKNLYCSLELSNFQCIVF